jgi:phosphohistidine phosphatase
VLCSSSLRARQTLAAVVPELESDAELRIEGALYSAGADELLARLRAVLESVPSVLLIGHNPGLQELALSLACGGGALERLRGRFPTAALATLAIPTAGWPELRAGDAELEGYLLPRELR